MSDLPAQVEAAILVADAVGYSHAMSVNEAGAHRALVASRRVIDRIVAQYHGAIFNTAGDSVLASYSDPLDAVRCALAMQEALVANRPEPCLVYRIGISFGRVLADSGNLLGDTVNIAARLESMAPAGGICVSGDVHAATREALGAPWQDLGLRHLKNIVRPVRVFRACLHGAASAGPAVAQARRPLLAVLPFSSIDPADQYLAEGFADDITAGLSRFSRLAVLGMASSEHYRDARTDLAAAAAELGIDYAVRGTVRRIGERVRLNAQLLDARTGLTLWAERFDGHLAQIFEAQDQMTATIVATLAGVIEQEGAIVVARKRTENMEAYDFLLRGVQFARALDANAALQALAMFEKSLALDPSYPQALAWLALMRLRLWALGLGPGDDATLLEPAQKALAIEPGESWCHLVYGQVQMYRRRIAEAEQHHQRAFELNPYDANVVALRAPLAVYQGQPEEGERWARLAMTLNPRYPDWYPTNLGLALYMQRRYVDAIAAYSGVAEPQIGILAGLAASYVGAGDRERASETADRLLSRAPAFSATRFVRDRPFVRGGDAELLLQGLQLAGLPS